MGKLRKPLWQRVAITPGLGVDTMQFGCSELALCEGLLAGVGEVEARRQNHDGEIELLVGGGIFRCLNDAFVECTFPDNPKQRVIAEINGAPLLSVFAWLGGQPDVVDRAWFRVSLAKGIAYDHRSPDSASYTVFAPGHWDSLLREGS